MRPGDRMDAMLVTKYRTQGEEKSSWVKIGAAFVNKDGSVSVKLDAFPAAGSDLVLQIPLTKEEREAKFGSYGQAARAQSEPRRNTSPGQGRGREPATGRGYGPPQRAAAPPPPQQELEPQGDPWIMPDGTPIYDARELPPDHPCWLPF